ncbi:complex I NDUFA9 subunit family protein [Brevundimonas sp. 2R-24]|uniref:Complex I NDUFA9 subunit family protein n=1 Tax=Peiella sedimenti TaxID=3061083 RepID=A0ABT8SH68_9CAUL|nr:complex I NDUFA9 subunit family protein [Caulobacteraceae bacterium XZ-24]
MTHQATLFGGSGFIGSQTGGALLRRDWRLRIVARKPQVAQALRPLGEVGQVQIKAGDVRRDEHVAEAVRGSELVVNFVGILHEGPGQSFDDVHVEAAERIARIAREAGVQRLIHVSALGADAGSASKYARSKAEGERAVAAAFPGAIIVRPSVVFGPGDDFLNRFARMAAFAPALPLVGGGSTRFQPVYVGDVADAIARLAVARDVADRPYELTGPSTYTFKELMELILSETNRQRPLVPLPFGVAGMIGAMGDLMAAVGLTPPLTRDQVELLKTDNVAADGAPGLEAIGVRPTGLEAVAESYLWRYRQGGQFAEGTAARA